jgi:hypothetical protein
MAKETLAPYTKGGIPPELQRWLDETIRRLNTPERDPKYNTVALLDSATAAPSALTGYAQIYVNPADGDLKIIFADGTIKTIVVDT